MRRQLKEQTIKKQHPFSGAAGGIINNHTIHYG